MYNPCSMNSAAILSVLVCTTAFLRSHLSDVLTAARGAFLEALPAVRRVKQALFLAVKTQPNAGDQDRTCGNLCTLRYVGCDWTEGDTCSPMSVVSWLLFWASLPHIPGLSIRSLLRAGATVVIPAHPRNAASTGFVGHSRKDGVAPNMVVFTQS